MILYLSMQMMKNICIRDAESTATNSSSYRSSWLEVFEQVLVGQNTGKSLSHFLLLCVNVTKTVIYMMRRLYNIRRNREKGKEEKRVWHAVEERNMQSMSHEKWRIRKWTRFVWYLHDTCQELHRWKWGELNGGDKNIG